MEAPQNTLETWGIVELLGRTKEIGFVTTEYYGAACLFRVDVPELPEREFVLVRPEWATDAQGNSQYVPVGTKVKRSAIPGRSPLIGISSIFKVTPCTEATARAAIEEFAPRQLTLLELAKNAPALPNGGSSEGDEENEEKCECGTLQGEDHADGCEFRFRS